MTTIDLLAMAFMNLWRRKLRALLTALGMAIGTTSIVVMISIGIGFNYAFEEQIAQMGSLTKIEVYDGGGWVYDATGNATKSDKDVKLDDKAVADFKKIENVVAVTPIMSSSGYIKSGKYYVGLQLLGLDMETAEYFNIVPTEGELPGKGSKTKPEMMLTSDVPVNFVDPRTYTQAVDSEGNPKIDLFTSKLIFTFDYNNISTQNLTDFSETTAKGKTYNLKTSGIMNNEGSWEYYCTGFIDINTLKELIKENKDFAYSNSTNKTYDRIWIKVNDIKNVQAISDHLREQGYQPNSLNDYIESFKKQSRQVQGVLGAIGAVSMLVAAIGITNTMLMSIYERTKEIGVIKVLGCKMSNIRHLFLTEAGYIGFFGGAAGLILSYGLSFVLNYFLQGMGLKSVIPIWLALGAVAFSALIAVVSGLYPAMRAMRLSALAAIRNE